MTVKLRMAQENYIKYNDTNLENNAQIKKKTCKGIIQRIKNFLNEILQEAE